MAYRNVSLTLTVNKLCRPRISVLVLHLQLCPSDFVTCRYQASYKINIPSFNQPLRGIGVFLFIFVIFPIDPKQYSSVAY